VRKKMDGYEIWKKTQHKKKKKKVGVFCVTCRCS
jgi:hypothetical protein